MCVSICISPFQGGTEHWGGKEIFMGRETCRGKGHQFTSCRKLEFKGTLWSGPGLEPPWPWPFFTAYCHDVESIQAAFLHAVLAHTGFDLDCKIIPEMRCQLAFPVQQLLQHCLAGGIHCKFCGGCTH